MSCGRILGAPHWPNTISLEGNPAIRPSLFVEALSESQKDSNLRPHIWASISLAQMVLLACCSLASSHAPRAEGLLLPEVAEPVELSHGRGACASRRSTRAAPRDKRAMKMKMNVLR